MTRPERLRVRDDPERLLTLGEAAELLGMPDMELGQAIRAGELAATAGWRRGRLTRLVRAGDLVAVNPDVEGASLPERVEVELADLSTTDVRPADEPVPDSSPEGGEEGEGDLGHELSDLRDQVRSTREDNHRLLTQLVESGQEVQGLFERLRDDEERYRSELAAERQEHERDNRALRHIRRTRTAMAIAFLVVLGVLIRTVALDDSAVHAGEAEEDQVADVPSGDTAGPDASAAGATEEGEGSSPESDAAGSGSADPDVTESQAVESAATDSSDIEPSDHEQAPDELTSPVPEASEPESLSLAPAPPGEPPCDFHSVTRPGSELRELLGPCAGAWSENHKAIAATTRRSEGAFCRHHAFFVTSLDGSIEGARELARLSEQEGLVAPLLDLRVDRAGTAFLRRKVDEWIQSGFEAGLVGGEDHRLESLEEPDRWRVHSWVRYLDFGGVEHRRRFVMELELSDGPSGDLLHRFEWSDTADPESEEDQ